MNQKTIILLIGSLALMLGVAFMFFISKEKPVSNEKSATANEENLVSNNENSEDLGSTPAVATVTYEPVIFVDRLADDVIDLRTQPIVLMDVEGVTLESNVDVGTLVRVSSPTTYDRLVFLKDKNSMYLLYLSYQLNKNRNPITLIKLSYDPTSFQDLNHGYFKDKESVYFFDEDVPVEANPGTSSKAAKNLSVAFKKLEGIDVNTARTLSLDIYEEARTISASLTYKDFIIDDESVYFKTTKIARNQDFDFIKWQERDNIFVTNYFRTDNRVFCQNKERRIEELPTDAKSFTPRLIYSQTFYANDTKQFYIDCDVLKDKAGSIVDPGKVSFEPLYSNDEKPTQQGLFIVGGNDIYFAQGSPFVTDVKNLNSFKLLNGAHTRRTFGYYYFGIDDSVYRVNTMSLYYYNVSPKEAAKLHNAASPVELMKTESPIDIETFEVLTSQVTKDKNRAYYLSYGRDYFLETFVPEDIASFEVFYCNRSGDLYADKYNVYNVRGSKEEGLEVSIIEGLHPEADSLEDSAPSPELYEELCGGGMG